MTKFMTQTEYADHRGISQPRISKMITIGKIPPSAMKMISGKKLIDRDKADTALAGSLDQIHNPNPEPRKRRSQKSAPTPPEMEQAAKKAGTQGMSLADAQKLQAQYKAALLKLEYEQKSDTLVNKVDVETEYFAMARQTRDAILNIPDRISAELASCTEVHAVSQKLTEALIECLEGLSK